MQSLPGVSKDHVYHHGYFLLEQGFTNTLTLMHMHNISYTVNPILALRKDLCALIKLKPVVFLRFQSLRRSLFMSDVDQLEI